MKANKPSRRSKRKRDLPTSSEPGRVETGKRSKRQQEVPLQESSPHLSGSKQEQHVDKGDSSVAPEFVDESDNTRGLQQMEHDGEGTSSDSDVEAEDVKDRVSRFPDLIQEKIFGFLNIHDKFQAAQVCSNWCLAVYKPCHWRHEKVSIDLDRVTKEELLSLSEREVSQIEVKGRNKSKMRLLLETFPSLVSLHFESKVQTDIFLHKVSECEFSSLKELSVMIESRRGHVPSSLQQSLSRLPSLQKISIKGRVTSHLVQAIGRELQGLEELSLHMNSGNLDATAISIGELKSLRCLSLQNVTLQDLSDFCEQNTRLKMLHLSRCRLPAADWPAKLARVTSLEELRLGGCSPVENLEPLQNLVNLKKIDVWPTEDSDWLSVAKVSSLEDVCMDLTDVTSDTIPALGSALTHLKALTLYGPCTIPPEVFVNLVRLPCLQSLHIAEVRTDNFVKTLIERPCQLRSLVLSYVQMTSPLELKHLAQISSLRELALDRIKVSSSGLSSLQQEPFQLETLELCHCGVTFESVKPLLRKQTFLRKLVMRGMEVREESLSSLHALLPNLEVCVLDKFSK